MSHAIFHAYQTQRVSNLPFWQPCLICVQSGTKRLHQAGLDYSVEGGGLILISAGVRCRLENVPDIRSGEYRAVAFDLCAEDLRVVSLVEGRPSRSTVSAVSIATIRPEADHALALDALVGLTSSAGHPALIRHRMQEVLLHWLLKAPELMGLLQAASLSFSAQVQALLNSDPARDWSLDQLAQSFHCSIPTVRRRLRDEETQFRSLLDDVRMVRGFNLLQTSHASLDQVAEQCGYLSRSRFSQRFQSYFGLTPSELKRTRLKR